MHNVGIGACAFLMAAASAASALQYTGSVTGSEGLGTIDPLGYPDSAAVSFTFSASAPVLYGTATYEYEDQFYQYMDGSSMPIGADETPGDVVFTFSSSKAFTVFSTPSDYTLYYADGDLMEQDYFHPESVAVDFFTPGGYDGSAFTFSVSPVPEPASWSLMLLGIGSVGSALRRGRRCLPQTSTPSA